MDSKKINQLGTEVDPQQSDLTVIGDPISGQLKKITWLQVAHLIGAQASVTLQQVTDNGNTTTDPITTGGLTLTNLGTGIPRLTNSEFVGTYGYGLANGVATLDSGGKIPASQLPSSVMEYKGVWNASTNTPTLADGTGDNGDVYLVNVAGTQNLGSGNITFAIGDWVVYNGTIWQKSLNSNAVASVFGRTGTIVAQEGDYNIDQLGDVAITTPATNDYLRYNGSSWVNTQFPTFVSSDKLVLQVRNTSGATINKGTVVYVNGASAGYPTIAKAQANADATSAQTIGMVQDNISNNSNGVVVIVGQITGVDTSAYTAGTQLYLSGSTAGAVTSTKTLAPTHLVYVGIVTTQNAVNGVIEVKIQNGYELEEIHDVALSSPINNQVLVYESATDLWKNKSISTIIGGTPVTGSGTNNYIPKFTTTGSTIGNSSLYYSEGANFNSYTFGSIGTGNVYNTSSLNIYSNNQSEIYFQFGGNKYLHIGDNYGDIDFTAANTGVHTTNTILYYKGSSANNRYLSFATEGIERLFVKQTGQVTINTSTFHGSFNADLLVGPLTSNSNTVLEIRSGATEQSSLYLTHGTAASAYNPDVEIFNSGNFGIVVYNPTVVSSNYVLYYASDSTTNRYLAFQTEGQDRLTINQNGSAIFSSSVRASAIYLTNMTAGSGALYYGTAEKRLTLANYNADGIIRFETGGGSNAGTINVDQTWTFPAAIGTTALNMNNMASLGSISGGSIYLPYTAVIMFRTTDGATARAKISADNSNNLLLNSDGGNVGINSTTTNNERLVVRQTTNSTSSVGFYTSATTGTSFGPIILAGTNSSDATLRILNQAGTSTYLHIRGDGNTGIGIDNPIEKLEVRGTNGTFPLLLSAGLSDGQNIALGFRTYVDGTSSIKGGIYYSRTATYGIGDFVFALSSNTSNETNVSLSDAKMTIKNGGNVLIGDTADYLSSRLYIKSAGATSSTNIIACLNSSGTDYFRVRSDGYTYAYGVYSNTTASAANVYVGSGGDFLRSTSSIKYKKNVVDYTKGLAEVMNLRPVNYQGKNEIDGDKVFAGLIAEEVHDAGLTEFVQYAEDGSPDALAYQNMVALLTKAIQEQQAQIEELKAKLN